LLTAAAMRIIASTVLAVTLFASSAARADAREWYGWQIMLSDAASMTLLFSNSTGAAVVGLVGYALGGPAIHVAHDDAPQAAIDFAGRVFLPIAGGALGAHAQPPCDECDGPPGAVIVGILGGALTAMVTDYALLSTHERVTVAPTKGGALVSLSGRF
jgi:hypothetical protein